MANRVNDEAMSNNESVGSMNSPSPLVPTQASAQILPQPPFVMPQSVAGVRAPLRARSISPRPRYTPYGVPLASTQYSGVELEGTRATLSENIQTRIDELRQQVSAVTMPLTVHVPKTSATVTQAQQIAAPALEKASMVEVGTVQLRSEMEQAIQAQL